MYNHLYSFIASHGINDIYFPFFLWFPIYSINMILSIFIPFNILNGLLFIGSIEHFSHDINLSFNQTLFISLPLIYYKDKKYIQDFIFFYLTCIHTPKSYYKNNLSIIQYIPCLILYIIIYNNKSFTNIIEYMIYNPGKKYKNVYFHKLLLGIIQSHVCLHFIASNYYYNLNK